jgi:hypothetical protein
VANRVVEQDTAREALSAGAANTVYASGGVLMLQLSTSTNIDFLAQQDMRALIAERVRGEFREMPGLTLTLAQARRLWSLDADTCNEVLTQLVASGFLCRRADGAFCRASDLTGRPVRFAHA